MQVDTLLSEYKLMIEKTSLLVQRFWLGLSKTDFMITDQIEVGVKIVDNYLEVKSLYESIAKQRPNHKEAVLLSIHFNQDVMNFELEALQAMNQLKNIDQKLKIT